MSNELSPVQNIASQPSSQKTEFLMREDNGIFSFGKTAIALIVAGLTAASTFLVTDFLNRPKLTVHIMRIEEPDIDTYAFSSLQILRLAEFFEDVPAVDELVSKAQGMFKTGDEASLRSAKILLPISLVTKALTDAEENMTKIATARSEFLVAKQTGDSQSAHDVLERWNKDKVITNYIPDVPDTNDKSDSLKLLDEGIKKLDKTADQNRDAIKTLREEWSKAHEMEKKRVFTVRALVVNDGNSAAALMGLGLLKGDNWNLSLVSTSDPTTSTSSSGIDGFALAPHQAVTVSLKTDLVQMDNSDDSPSEIASQQFKSGGMAKCRLNMLTSSNTVIQSDPFPFGSGERYKQRAMEILSSH